VDGPGTLQFWWKVSSEQGSNFLVFASNGMILILICFQDECNGGIVGEWQDLSKLM